MNPSEDTCLLLSREELREANCCRFCGYGAKKDSVAEQGFVRMYEKVVEEEDLKSVTLDVLINKYLPITVSSHELYYPQVICSSCDGSLHLTVEFFQKIAKGQKILAKIINEISQPQLKKEENKEEEEAQTSLVFSGENPIVLAPKRRGRPRRDPNKPKVPKAELAASEYLESKPKRQSRRPVRYEAAGPDAFSDVVIKEEAAEEPPEVHEDDVFPYMNQENLEPHDRVMGVDGSKVHDVNQVTAYKTDGGNLVVLHNVSSEFTSLTRTDNLMDLSKLSVIMDGDEEIEASPQVTAVGSSLTLPLTSADASVQSQDSVATAGKDLEGPPPSGVSAPSETSQNNQSEAAEDDDAVLCISNDYEAADDDDSDASVKTIDFVTKPRSKRGRKKPRRKLNRKKVECELCKRVFSHSSSLAYHRSSAHGDVKNFVCTICSKAFTHKQLLINHSYVHSDDKRFKCHLCPSKFKSKASLYTHKMSIHSTNAPTCEHCGSRFTLKSSLKAHMRLHTGEKPYTCEYCQKPFSQKSNYTEHRRTHTGERPYKCDVENCDRAFTTKSQLRSHKVTHTGAKQYLCSVCGRGFTHAENFKYHMRRHNGEKPLGCPICLKQFTEPWSLKKHCRLHTGEKPYSCEICCKTFSDPSNFAKHKKFHAMEGMPPQEETPADQDSEMQPETEETNANAEDPSSPSTDKMDTQDASVVEAQVVSQLIAEVEQPVEGVAEFTTDGGYIQIINPENLTGIEEGGQDGQQVIYLLPEDLSYYTITISGSEDAMEARASEETLQALGGHIAYAAVDADLAAQYFNLDSVAGTTITVPAITEAEAIIEAVESSSTDIIQEGTK